MWRDTDKQYPIQQLYNVFVVVFVCFFVYLAFWPLFHSNIWKVDGKHGRRRQRCFPARLEAASFSYMAFGYQDAPSRTVLTKPQYYMHHKVRLLFRLLVFRCTLALKPSECPGSQRLTAHVTSWIQVMPQDLCCIITPLSHQPFCLLCTVCCQIKAHKWPERYTLMW